MATSPGAQTAPNDFDLDSLNVNPGSPRSPPLTRKFNEKISSSTTEDTDLQDAVLEKKVSEPDALRFTIDPSGPLTHDETTVDIVTVSCPGSDPLRSWNRDGLISRYFGAPSMRYAEAEGDDRPGPSWVRQGIRREANAARILLYEHPIVGAETTLKSLADALLEELQALRLRERRDRPLVFIGHSIGGIVVKMALVKAYRDVRYSVIFRESYGVAFFGTPHQGSSYFAMPSLASSIQNLLQLASPLPTSVTDDLRVGNSLLSHVDEDFKCISNDLRVWTFYETIDSRLSGSGSGDVYFTAPLASIKSAILGMRQERIFPLQSDHANIASFGRHNVHTLDLFLKQLAWQIRRADENSRDHSGRWTLDLEQKVNIEVHGFFEDTVGPDSAETPVVRAWSTRLPLREFLNKGPEACLSERLNEVEGAPEESRFLRARGRTSVFEGHKNALGIQNQASQNAMPPTSPVIRPVDARPGQRAGSAPTFAPPGPVTPPSRPLSPMTRHSTTMYKPSPLIRADFEQDLAIDRLSRPIRPRVGRSASRSFSESSRFEYRDFPPFSQRSRSTMDVGPDNGEGDDDGDIEASPKLPESVVAIRKVVQDGKRRTSETVIVDEVPVAFVKPEVKARKFTWVHLPYNNPTWVKNVLEALQVSYKKDLSPLYNHDFWATKHTRGRHAQHYAYFAKPSCYFTAPRPFSPRSHHTRGGASLSPSMADESMFTCLFLPYLHFDSYKRLIRRRDMIIQRLNHGRARPIPEHVSKSDSLELQVIWEYLGHDPPINCRRTLDQYGYPSLRDTRSRDDDQMLYKLTKERVYFPGQQRDLNTQGSSSRPGSDGGGSWRERVGGQVGSDTEGDELKEDVLNGNVLMVDQLWLWVLNSDTVLSFFPKRESDPIEGPLYQQADLRDSIFNEVNVDLTRQCENALDLAALAALHAVSVLLDRSSHPDLEVFRIFEEAISVLTEKLTSSLKAFRMEGFRDKASDYEPVENKERSIRARHKKEGRRAELENRNNTSALLELRDLEDELLLLVRLFERQSKVISAMHAVYTRPEMRDLTVNGRIFLTEALKRLGDYSHQADEMVTRVRSTRDDYDKLLQMVQRQAQVDEVRLSRLHADLASAQSRSITIFTTFTVIFLPLTFFTGLFGMNTREWGGEGNLPLKTIGTISLPSSAVLVVVALVIAWSTSVRRFFRWISKLYGRVMRWLYIVAWRPAARIVARKLRERRKGKQTRGDDWEGKRGLKKEASDFWQRHRLERERGYHIPEVNKKGVAEAGSGSRGKKDSRGR